MTSQRVEVAPGVGLDVRVWPEGDGRAFLLVHGLASNARMWDGVVEELQALGHPAATVDQRGHGRSDKPDHGYDMARVADDAAAVVEALGWSRPVVVGQSWGGNVVIELAHRHPELVAGVVAVDGGTIELARPFPEWDACAAAMRPPPTTGTPLADLEQMLRGLHPDWPESGIAGMLANWEVRADGTVAPWLTLERHLLILRGLWEHHPSALYASIQVPVLLVPAAGGFATTDEAVGLLPRGRVRPLAGDHDLHAQHPAAVAEVLHESATDGFFT
ncbi:MAG: alpha/beta hydrolase [Actinobacteria bacterium]|nr:alpha/beta hydrolase [Actinomycetota bacterium]